MARPLRVEFEDAIYHLCARGNARQTIFHDEQDRARFVDLLTESTRRFEAAIQCLVLMGNHFHLVAQTHRPTSLDGSWSLTRCISIDGIDQAVTCFRGGTRDFWYSRVITCWG